jgi:hypothetical protein
MGVQPTYRPTFEPLETRELLAVQAFVTGGMLNIVGSSGTDFIQVSQVGQQISVMGTQINVNGIRAGSVDAGAISQVLVYGSGGNDFINLGTLKNAATIYGGTGSDYIRCGPGNETVVRDGGFDTVFRPFNPSSPVVNGATETDIQQGDAPLCQTLAALVAAAKQGHNFANDIQYLGNNYYQVKLYGNLASQRVYFDGWTTNTDPVEPSSGEFWMVLMQRARLQALGIDPTRSYTDAEWDRWDQRNNGRLYSVGEAMYNFTGIYPTYNDISTARPLALQAALAHGDYLVAQSGGAYVSADGIIGNHAYAITAVYYDAGGWKVRLYNPWGIDRENGATVDALDRSHPAANDGYLTLSWQQFIRSNNFRGYYQAVKR